MTRPHNTTGLLLAGAALCALAPVRPCIGQSLHGSTASVNRMYRHARAEKLAFYETSRGIRKAVAAGRLVRLVPDDDFDLRKVSYPYVRSTTRTLVERLGRQYRAACGEQLVVTSAVRPATRQPANSVARSVHPTGMAVDLHKSDDPECRAWLRATLRELEGEGVLEATEEFSPPHFHVAVYPTAYRRYVAMRTRDDASVQLASSGASDVVTYIVRRGDTLSEIAEAHDTTVSAIVHVNHLDGSDIQAGQTLLIPSGG